MRNLDGEDAWKRFFNSLRPEVRHRYHRLNVQFPGPEPSLDSAFEIPDLKANVLQSLEGNKATIQSILDGLIASLFYFELDELPLPTKDGFLCSGSIFCRLNLPKHGLRHLYNQLLAKSSWFLIQGDPVSCVQSIPQGLPPFRKQANFQVKRLDELVTFSIRGITHTIKSISGFPTTLEKLIKDQKLISPFGTVEHFVADKRLPLIPKRKYSVSHSRQASRNTKRVRVE